MTFITSCTLLFDFAELSDDIYSYAYYDMLACKRCATYTDNQCYYSTCDMWLNNDVTDEHDPFVDKYVCKPTAIICR